MQHFSGISNNTFTTALHLRQYCPNASITTLGVQDEGFIQPGLCLYMSRSERRLQLLKGLCALSHPYINGATLCISQVNDEATNANDGRKSLKTMDLLHVTRGLPLMNRNNLGRVCGKPSPDTTLPSEKVDFLL